MSLVRFSNQYPSLFDRFFENDMYDCTNRNYSKSSATLPSVNIKEHSGDYEVEVAAPGFDKQDFNIELNNDLLTISSEKKMDESKEDDNFTRKEFNYFSFTRTFIMPKTVNSEGINAKYENGILKVSIPKKEEAKEKPLKKIEIS